MQRTLRPHFIALLTLALSASAGAQSASRRNAVVEVVERAGPAVVFIGTEQGVERRFRQRTGDENGIPVDGLGSGVLIDPSGLIVTNEHVIRGAAAIHVQLADGRQLDAEVVGADADNDLAVLRVRSATPLPSVTLGTSADLMIGETTIAIGSPYGLEKTVTVGVVSATGRSFEAGGRIYNDFLQTDAAINPGNSGGPLLNVNGEVIGINTAIYAGASGIGFAIPADKVRRIITELTEHGKVRPAWVGVQTGTLTRRVARGLGWERSYGVLVTGLEAGSPAEAAGVRVGDLITEVGGARVKGPEDFRVRLRGYPAKASVPFLIFRDGQEQRLSVTAVEYPADRAAALAWERLGVRVQAVRGGLLVTSVRADSPAAEVGLREGDGILRLDNRRLQTEAQLREGLVAARGKSSVLLVVLRGRSAYYVTLPF